MHGRYEGGMPKICDSLGRRGRRSFFGRALVIQLLVFLQSNAFCDAVPRESPQPSPGAVQAPPQPAKFRGHVFELENESKFKTEPWQGLPPQSQILAIYDFNSDGRSDLLVVEADRKKLRVYFSEAGNSFRPGRPFSAPFVITSEGAHVGTFLGVGRVTVLLWSKLRDRVIFTEYSESAPTKWVEKGYREPGYFPDAVVKLNINMGLNDDIVACGGRPKPWAFFVGDMDGVSSFHFEGMPFCLNAGDRVPLGSFDSDGSGRDTIIVDVYPRGHRSQLLHSADLLSSRHTYLLAEDAFLRWEQVHTGDFDGDGRDDLLLTVPDSPNLWWVAFSNGKEFYPRPLPAGSVGKPQPEERIFTGDFDGDGLFDILRRREGNDSASFISLSRISRPRAGVSVRFAGETVRTKDDGSFEFAVPRNDDGVVEIADPDFQYFRTSIPVVQKRHTWRFVSFLGLPAEKQTVGAPMSRFGDVSGPYVCLGFNPGDDSLPPSFHTGLNCAENYAPYAVERGMGNLLSCCRLPSDDVLTKETVLKKQPICPPDFVLTGGLIVHTGDSGSDPMFRCTRINTNRYRLGAPRGAELLGESSTMWNADRRYVRTELPLAIRFGINRQSVLRWGKNGCIGQPIGSLLTGVDGKECSSKVFRELQYAGAEGDPGAGTPVKMFPDCASLAEVNDPNSGCVLRKQEAK